MTRTELVYSAERVVKSANALWRVIQRLEPEVTVNRTLSPR